jgi:PTS system beta-glucosides-specific IIC component
MSQNLGKTVLDLVGGEKNVMGVSHCATRLRFTLIDDSKADTAALKETDGVLGIVQKGGQYQVVIGPTVDKVYRDLVNGTGLEGSASGSADSTEGEKKGIASVFMETISALFTPILPLLAGSGVLRGLVLLATQIGILSTESSTYVILTCASTAVFYFLPILLAFTAAQKFGCSPFVSVAIMGSLIMPDFVALMGDIGNGAMADFMGLPIVLMTYSSTVIPAVLSIWVFSKLQRWLEKVIPETVQLCFVPLISLFVMVPLTAGVIGPLGVYLGNGIAWIVTSLVSFNGWIAGAVVGGFWNILVIFGIHWAVNPVMIQNVATLGYDYIVPFTCATNFGMAGATFGVFLRTKDQKMKQFSLSALLSIFFAGITEPAIYGVGLKYKKPIAAAFIGGAIGGAFMGGMGVKAYAFVFGGLTTIPAFAGPTLPWYVLGLAICFVVSTIAMVIMGVDDTEAIAQQAKVDALESAAKASSLRGSKVLLPVPGEVKDLSECTDAVFSNRELGDGILVIPSEGKVVAPFDGTVTALFDTGHAIGITSNTGLEVLIHLGLDTVELNGKPFDVKVSQGEKVKAGQLLMNVDLEQIKAAGKSIETPIVVTNAGDLQVVSLKAGELAAGAPVISIQ